MRFLKPILFLLSLLISVPRATAQQTPSSNPTPAPAPETTGTKPISPYIPPPPPPADTSGEARPQAQTDKQISPSIPPAPPSDDTAATAPAAESAEPSFDPYHAQKSLDVGTFYLKKGNYDAAIDRFQEAARYQPSLAAPWRLLGEAYEKQHAYSSAAESYKKYLEVFPTATDAAKITKEISLLEEKTGKEAAKIPVH